MFVCASSSTSATLRTAGEDRVDVHLLEFGAAVLDPAAGHDLEVAELLRGARPAVGLDEADDHVGAALVAPATLVEHRERLADAGRRAEIQTKLAACHTTSVTHPLDVQPYFDARYGLSSRIRPPPELVAGATVVVVGDVPPGLAGGDFDAAATPGERGSAPRSRRRRRL